MEYNTEAQLILNSLIKEKKELTDKVAEIDKVIKRIRYGNINLGLSKGFRSNNPENDYDVIEQPSAFPLKADLKVQIIKIMDILGQASKLKDIQEKYKELTGYHSNLRETVRTLNKHDILKLLQPKNSIRGLYWVKAEWLEDNNAKLKEQYKFEGFDLLFTDDMIEFK